MHVFRRRVTRKLDVIAATTVLAIGAAISPGIASETCQLTVGNGSLVVPDGASMTVIHPLGAGERGKLDSFYFNTGNTTCHMFPELKVLWSSGEIDHATILDAHMAREREKAERLDYDLIEQRAASEDRVQARGGHIIYIARSAEQQSVQRGKGTRYHTKVQHFIRFSQQDQTLMGPFAYCVAHLKVSLTDVDLSESDRRIEALFASYGPIETDEHKECPE